MKVFAFILFSFVASIAHLAAEVTPVTAKKAEAALTKKDSKVVVIDIRTPEEFKEGHLKGAVNINFRGEDFEKKLAKLDRTKTYVMHCRSGGRSTASIPVWDKLKFEKVLHLDTGVLGWEKAGFKLVTPKKASKKSE